MVALENNVVCASKYVPLTIIVSSIYPKVLRGIGHRDWPKRAIIMPLCCLDFRDLTEISSRIPSCCVGERGLARAPHVKAFGDELKYYMLSSLH